MSDPAAIANATYWNNPWDCTPAICPLDEYGQLNYLPNLAANVLYATLFGLGAIAQIALGIRYKSWAYMGCMLGGIGLELVGYAGRIELHMDDYNDTNFIIYLVGATIGPALFSAAIYLVLIRIIGIYGASLSIISARKIAVFFMLCDLLSLALQAAGGAIADLADTPEDSQNGINIMIGGLSTQVGSTSIFCLICLHLMWNIRKNPYKINPNTSTLRASRSFRSLLWAIGIATVTILIRCCYRVAELRGGFGGSLANNEVLFMIFDGAMMLICVFMLTARHPGLILGNIWHEFSFKNLKQPKHTRSSYDSSGKGGRRRPGRFFEKHRQIEENNSQESGEQEVRELTDERRK